MIESRCRRCDEVVRANTLRGLWERQQEHVMAPGNNMPMNGRDYHVHCIFVRSWLFSKTGRCVDVYDVYDIYTGKFIDTRFVPRQPRVDLSFL